jgi:hypothetical protein
MNRIAFVLILLEFPVKSGRKVCFSKKNIPLSYSDGSLYVV